MSDKSILTLQHPGEPAISTKIDTKGYVSETAERVIAQANEIHKLRMENKFLLKSKAEIQAAAILGYSENMRGLMVEAETKNEAGVSMMCSFAIKTSVKYAATLTASKEGD